MLVLLADVPLLAVPVVVAGDEAEVVMLPEMGVWLAGKVPVGAVAKVPEAEVDEQTDGTLEAVGSPLWTISTGFSSISQS